MTNLESIKITLELISKGAVGKSDWARRATGKYHIKRMWLFYLVKYILVLLPFAVLSYILYTLFN